MKNGDAGDKVSVYVRPPQAVRAVEQPNTATAWAEFAVELSCALTDLNEDEYLIISTKRNPYFVQFAGQGSFGLRAETVSNQYLSRDKKLPNEVAAMIVELGWKTSTNLPENLDPEGHNPDGSPNYFLDIAPPVPYEALAKLGVQTLKILGPNTRVTCNTKPLMRLKRIFGSRTSASCVSGESVVCCRA
jgi:hypothetical protein